MSQPFEPTRRELLRAAVVAGSTAFAVPTVGVAVDKPATLQQAKPEDIGIDSRRLQTAYDLLEKWTTGPNAPVLSAAISGRALAKLVARVCSAGKDPSSMPARSVVTQCS